MKPMYLRVILCVLFFYCFTIEFVKAEELPIDSIVSKTEDYVSRKAEDLVDDRYGIFSPFRVFYHVCLGSDEMRKKSWEEYFTKNGLSNTAIQSHINELVKVYNAHNKDKLNAVEIPLVNSLDETTFNLIVKRERYEVLGYLATILLGMIVGAIIGAITGYFVNIESYDDFPKGVIRLIQIVTFGIGVFFLFKFLVPIEEDIVYNLTNNIYNQISNLNIFEQL